MKIYVVTSGCYSDYYIDKVFTDKNKAEEFVEWHGWYDDSRIEEYETEDNLVVDKYYRINISARVYPNGILGPDIRVAKERVINKYNYLSVYDGYYKISLHRSIPAENWDEEFYTKKYTKALYDMISIIKYHKENGVSMYDIQKLIEGYVGEE